LNFDR